MGKGKNEKKNGQSEKALAKTEADVLAELDKLLDGDEGLGLEKADGDDCIIPRIALCQGQSRAVQSGEPDAPVAGQLINTVTKEVYDPPIEIVPLFLNKTAIKFPEELSDPILCRANDAKLGIGDPGGECVKCNDYFKDWSLGQPTCTLIYEFVCLMKSDDPANSMPFIISMMRTSSRTAQTLISTAKAKGAKAPFFLCSYTIGAELRESKGFKYWAWTQKFKEVNINAKDYIAQAKMLKELYLKGVVSVDYEDSVDRVESSDDVPDFPAK